MAAGQRGFQGVVPLGQHFAPWASTVIGSSSCVETSGGAAPEAVTGSRA